MARATISPTTDPIDPPMKLKSMPAIDTGCPPTVPVAACTASFCPVSSIALSSRWE